MIEIVFKLDENKAIAYDSENKVGECDFEKIDDIWNITHTEVDSDYQGQGIARKLVENVIENSRKKLQSKHCDMICANSLRKAGAGFGGYTNIITILTAEREIELEQMTKDEAAHRILDTILESGL